MAAPTKNLLLVLVVAAAVGIVAPHGAEAAAAGRAVTGLVTGVVPCSAGSSINAASVPGFPNAGVQMVCGGRVMGGATSDGTGAFTINMGALNAPMLMAMAGNQCKVVVTTPLAACDASLAAVNGTLTAPVRLLGGSGTGGLGGLGGLITLITQILDGLLGEILSFISLSFSLV